MNASQFNWMVGEYQSGEFLWCGTRVHNVGRHTLERCEILCGWSTAVYLGNQDAGQEEQQVKMMQNRGLLKVKSITGNGSKPGLRMKVPTSKSSGKASAIPLAEP